MPQLTQAQSYWFDDGWNAGRATGHTEGYEAGRAEERAAVLGIIAERIKTSTTGVERLILADLRERITERGQR